jgi:hypothetical protein
LVDFTMVIAGAGITRFTIRHVTIELGGTEPVNPPTDALKPGSGVGVVMSGVMYVHSVASGSLTKPACGVSVTETVEVVVGVGFSHWNVANPGASVVACAVEPVAPAGRVHDVGVGDTVAASSHPWAGWRSSTAGSGFRSTSFWTVTDGAHSWKAAARSEASRSEKSATR